MRQRHVEEADVLPGPIVFSRQNPHDGLALPARGRAYGGQQLGDAVQHDGSVAEEDVRLHYGARQQRALLFRAANSSDATDSLAAPVSCPAACNSRINGFTKKHFSL